MSIHALIAKIWPDKIVRWCRDGDFLRPVFAALNRGCHLYSAGRPSRWAMAHISSFFYKLLLVRPARTRIPSSDHRPILVSLSSYTVNSDQQQPFWRISSEFFRLTRHLRRSMKTVLQCRHWRRQLWSTGARAPLTSNNLIFFS